MIIVILMEATLRERLRRLGLQKGTAHLKPPVTAAPMSPAVAPLHGDRSLHDAQFTRLEAQNEHQLWNVEQRTPYGTARIRRTVYHLDHQHGDRPLHHALHSPLAEQDFQRALFLDTETTGLAGGAGTLAFLVGVGYFQEMETGNWKMEGRETDDFSLSTQGLHFVIDQFFLSDPSDEAAMLVCIDKLVNGHDSLVTFNGKTFDVPLLETRFTLARIAPSFGDKVHLDLLQYARRAWRGMLSSLSLGSLEFHLLGVRRDQQDIAGFLIPQLYRDYLQAGAAAQHEEMSRVMYHNLYDILSMVTLAARLYEVFERPTTPDEHLAVGRHHERNGDLDRAIAAYLLGIGEKDEGLVGKDEGLRIKDEGGQSPILNPQSLTSTMHHLAQSLKRAGRRDEAAGYWEILADADDVEALIELAKHYEWHAVDHTRALMAARRALKLARDPITRREFEKRVTRLTNKAHPTQKNPHHPLANT